MDDQSAALAVHEALRQRRFVRVPSTAGVHAYKGTFTISGGEIPICVKVNDLDFINYPDIRIDESWSAPNRFMPHILGPGGAICYYAAGSVVLDRYNPGGTAIQCLERSEEVLRDALKGLLDHDFAVEFRAYWSETWILYDLPSSFDGKAYMHFLSLDGRAEMTPVLYGETSWFRKRFPAENGAASETVVVLPVKRALSIDPQGNWPPNNLGELSAWFRFIDPDLDSKLDCAIASGSGALTTIGLHAPNGLFVVRIRIPPLLQKPEFLASRRTTLPRILRAHGREVGVERISADAASLDYVYERNLGTRRGLRGKRIMLAGCGAIGGYLAHQLAQSGAGVEGRFLIIDDDTLKPANLGRHLLGVPFLHRNKAEATAEFLNAQLPGARVEAHAGDAMKVQDWVNFDLVIDATGEEALSIALNQRAVSLRPMSPPHLYVWLLGNGAIAQALLADGSTNACLKCLKPSLSGQPRFRALRPNAAIEEGAVVSCGDAGFVPYPASRPTAAAALACDMVLDWANGEPQNRLRSFTLNPQQAFQIKDSSPAALEQCPCCGPVR